MKSIISLPSEVAERVRTAWYWIEEQVSVSNFPEDLKNTFRICFQVSVCELIARHYVDGLTREKYLDEFDHRHIEDMMVSTIEGDEDGTLTRWINGMVVDSPCNDNPFWAMVITNYLRATVTQDLANEVDPTDLELCTLALSIASTIGGLIETVLAEHDFLSGLGPLPSNINVDNVEVSLPHRSITIWS